jgi:hypothetical protein
MSSSCLTFLVSSARVLAYTPPPLAWPLLTGGIPGFNHFCINATLAIKSVTQDDSGFNDGHAFENNTTTWFVEKPYDDIATKRNLTNKY